MNFAKEARKLADFITGLEESFLTHHIPDKICYNHIGALYTDVVLQSGLNYNSVVKPRVQKVLFNYPEACTVRSFRDIIDKEGIENVIKWSHSTKQERMFRLLDFSEANKINTCEDFRQYLTISINRQRVLGINGIGPKTLDYLLKLLNFDSVAVDRHIYSFVQMADVPIDNYYTTKKIVEFAADLLEIPRSSVDYSIWKFMSNKKEDLFCNASQLSISF